MIDFFRSLFNFDKIDDMQYTIDVYRKRNKQLEEELEEYKEYKLKYRVTKLYVDDDEGLLELFEMAESKERQTNDDYNPFYHSQLASARQAQAQAALYRGSLLGGLGIH